VDLVAIILYCYSDSSTAAGMYFHRSKKNNHILHKLAQLPLVSLYAKTHGWPYLIAWCHRLAGIILVFYACFHIYTLSLLETPARYTAKMQIFGSPLFVFFEWLLAFPVIFHALNGGRLILYESFGNREDNAVIKWLLSFSAVYALFLGSMMIAGNQNVSALFFWFAMLVAALSLVYLVTLKIRHTAISNLWKLQRIGGVFLLIMIPAHLIFMHLNLATGHEAGVVVARMQSSFIKTVDIALILVVLFHGGYGLLSVAKDYLPSGFLQQMSAIIIFGVMIVFAWIGVRLVLVV
jgi:succinate dehydrogenase hydrophobic anchor subunit